MSITLELYQLRNFWKDASEIGATTALIKAGLVQANITQAEAWRRFKRHKVEKWVKLELVEPIKNGKTVEFDLATLEILNKESQHSYLKIIK